MLLHNIYNVDTDPIDLFFCFLFLRIMIHLHNVDLNITMLNMTEWQCFAKYCDFLFWLIIDAV